MKPRPTIHRDGTVTYWSVYQQVWRTRVPIATVSDRDLAAMPEQERNRVLRARQSQEPPRGWGKIEGDRAEAEPRDE